MKNYAIIDFSIGSISLLIAGVGEKSQEIIFKTSTHLLLSSFITSSGRLKKKGIDRILEEASSLLKMANSLKVEKIYAISTTLLRNLENAEEVERIIKEKTGLEEIPSLSGADEAYAVYVANERYRILEKALLMHIGSSSTEICDYNRPIKESMFNLDFGSETLQRNFVKYLYPDEKELEDIREYVLKGLEENRDITGKSKFENAVVAGTNAETIYRIYQSFYEIEDDRVPLMQTKKLEKLQKALQKEKKRTKLLLDNAPEKAYMVIPVLEALLAILKYFKINDITVSSLGVKEGWFRYIMENRNEERETTD